MPVFDLPAEFTIYSVQTCHEALLNCIRDIQSSNEPGQVLHVNAEPVMQIDAAGVQILLSLEKMHGIWSLRNPSNAIQQACQDYGLQTLLALTETEGRSP